MFAISVFFEIDPAHVRDFTAAALEHAGKTLANERDCIAFDIFSDPDDGCRLYFHECYTDKNAVEDVHNKTPYFAAFGERTKGWILKREPRVWESVG
jgi:quinol monooxygenase YgiN